MDNHEFSFFRLVSEFSLPFPLFILPTVAFCLSVWVGSISLSFVLLFLCLFVSFFYIHTYIHTMDGGF